MKQMALIGLVFMAIVAIQTQKLRRAVIYMGVFSLSISFVYLLYNAPDVAIAEAVIGSTLTTVLYLVALQKYTVFTVYCPIASGPVQDEHYVESHLSPVLDQIEAFCAKQELEPLIIYTTDDLATIRQEHPYELIMEAEGDQLWLTVHPENLKVEQLELFLNERLPLYDIIIEMEQEDII